ncbi:LOW QUALITY PROTEIN: hypothetical protein Cgig2_008599 [Carnegiea gigantea]|uniref:Uncharacterized protein n=1 Tax=Carnegiea gigantea TaxID=171969 RepID=A0A9Q1Q7A1_9CARY|nr:LOW QUALITY PROTEIN: hypothetical protein Cgig2_008599 [Carnegiea gigantea]
MKVNRPFPNHIDLINDWDVVVRQAVKYEWQPVKCSHCQMLGHEEEKEDTIRKEWRVINRDNREGKEMEESTPQVEGTKGNKGFTAPRRRSGRHKDQPKETYVAPGHNSFQEDIKVFLNKHKVSVLGATYQMVHCRAQQVSNHKQFCISFMYGMNNNALRQPLWRGLRRTAERMHMTLGVLGDFNAILYPKERIGRDGMQNAELIDFAKCLERTAGTEKHRGFLYLE